MKATLEFNLDDPDDRQAHLRAVKSFDMAILLFELQFNFWKEFEEIDPELIYKMRHRLGDEFEKYNLNPDELIS